MILLLGFGVEEITGDVFRVAAVITPAALAVYGFSFCFVWGYTVARTAYVVQGHSLVAIRGARRIVCVPISEIESLEVNGWMDAWHMVTDPTPPPDWPSVTVWLRSGRSVILPEIMVWGRREASAIASSLRLALDEERRRQH